MASAEFRYFAGKSKKRYPKGGVDGTWRIYWKDELGQEARDTLSSVETETEALDIAKELERKAERTRLGLDEAPPPPTLVRDAFKDFFEKRVAGVESAADVEARWRLHILPVIGDKLVTKVLPADIEGILTRMKRGYAPERKDKEERENKVVKYSAQMRKHVRATLYTFFEFCIRKAGLRRGVNPVDEVAVPKLPKRIPVALDPAEVRAALAVLDDEFRDIVATAYYTGLRKNEICGLQPADVHLAERFIHVQRSYDKPYPKDEEERIVSIPEPLVPYLVSALARVRSKWLFPNLDGSMRTKDFDAARMFQSALARAGVVEGYDFKCRRQGCGYVERRADDAVFPCPKCSFMLWAVPVPKKHKFKDLRSTYGTYFYRRSGDARATQKQLGHASMSTTDRYIQQDMAHLLAAANRMATFLAGEEVPPVYPPPTNPPHQPPSPPHQVPQEVSGVVVARSRGLEPLTSGVTGARNPVESRGMALQPVATSALARCDERQPEADETPQKRGVPPVCPPRLKALESSDCWLASREVAELLGGVTLAAVSYHVKRGALRAEREGGQLRFRRADVEAFLARRGGGT